MLGRLLYNWPIVTFLAADQLCREVADYANVVMLGGIYDVRITSRICLRGAV